MRHGEAVSPYRLILDDQRRFEELNRGLHLESGADHSSDTFKHEGARGGFIVPQVNASRGRPSGDRRNCFLTRPGMFRKWGAASSMTARICSAVILAGIGKRVTTVVMFFILDSFRSIESKRDSTKTFFTVAARWRAPRESRRRNQVGSPDGKTARLSGTRCWDNRKLRRG